MSEQRILTTRQLSSAPAKLVAAIWSLCIAGVLIVAVTQACAAGDFVLNYAIDTNGNTDAGKIESCRYEEPYEIRPVGLRIRIYVHPRKKDLPSLDMDVLGPPGCCYTADAAEQFHVAIKPGLVRLPIYRGVRRSGTSSFKTSDLVRSMSHFLNCSR
ncbi:hypothetical protein [Bradyrhizobium sp. STM 3843]|uniref:hypothetical protein n=1 Tax=Bradyrhizobium sp. STM 3843 TaxID=551947 RepID=UPI00111196F5|nr:hypothetical protein [Bradyrhizobium sp. STM 3843]